mgnify:CR=1 FL=1
MPLVELKPAQDILKDLLASDGREVVPQPLCRGVPKAWVALILYPLCLDGLKGSSSAERHRLSQFRPPTSSIDLKGDCAAHVDQYAVLRAPCHGEGAFLGAEIDDLCYPLVRLDEYEAGIANPLKPMFVGDDDRVITTGEQKRRGFPSASLREAIGGFSRRLLVTRLPQHGSVPVRLPDVFLQEIERCAGLASVEGREHVLTGVAQSCPEQRDATSQRECIKQDAWAHRVLSESQKPEDREACRESNTYEPGSEPGKEPDADDETTKGPRIEECEQSIDGY